MDTTDNEPDAVAAALAASSATQRKWASFVLLGPLVPSLLAIVNIVIGGAIVKADVIDLDADNSCGYRVDHFVSATIVNSYLLLVVFAWSFLGFETHFSIRGRRRRLFSPFSSLALVAFLYLLLFVLSVAIWIFGTWAVAKDVEGGSCSRTVPVLYAYSVFLVVVYWVGVMFGGVELVGTMCGKRIKSGAQSSIAKTKQYAEDRDKRDEIAAERQVVGRKFDERDEEGNGTIEREQAEDLIEELGLGLKPKKLKKVLAQLDPSGEGVVSRDDFLNWYAEKAHPGD